MAKAATSGGKRRADTEVMRAKAAKLYAEGMRARDVASALGITERRARSLKGDVAKKLRAAASDAIEGLVDGAKAARARIAAKADDLAATLVDAARGTLRAGVTPREVKQLREQGREVPLERDPQMVNARVRAASTALQFVLAQKVETNVAPLSPETAAQVAAIVRAQQHEEDDGQP